MTITRTRILTLLSLFLLSTTALLAQSEVEAPNYKAINKQTADASSPLYYPRLMNRYLANDTTLVLEEYRALYYGFPAQEDYDPYRISPYNEKLKEFTVGDTITAGVCDSIVAYGLKAVADFPFDLRAMNMLIYGYQCLHDEAQSRIWTMKMTGILDAIISSGNGEKKESAYYVIYMPHEYDIISRFGLSATDTTLESPYDYVKVGDNKFGVKGYYFNISPILDVYHRKFE